LVNKPSLAPALRPKLLIWVAGGKTRETQLGRGQRRHSARESSAVVHLYDFESRGCKDKNFQSVEVRILWRPCRKFGRRSAPRPARNGRNKLIPSGRDDATANDL